MRRTASICWVIQVSLALCGTAPAAEKGDMKMTMEAFKKACEGDWKEAFHDSCTRNWKQNWTLDGRKATVACDDKGMVFSAGPTRGDDAHHAVLWTKQSFEGDVKIEYEYTRLDNVFLHVNILYVQATGSGRGPYKKDIAEWAERRRVPSMKMYFDHMNTYHVSYAAFGNRNDDPTDDYIRARRYSPETGKGLRGTDLKPDYSRTGLFATGVPHRMTVIKRGTDLFLHVRGKDKEMVCHWDASEFPAIAEGRIGLRHMYTRSARYRDFRVFVGKDGT
jgi:hypothetical protein